MTVDTKSLRYISSRSSKNCDLQFANIDRQTDRFKEDYCIDSIDDDKLVKIY